MTPAPPAELIRAARREMPREACRIVDAARARGIVLRLMGGVAVRAHCAEVAFCDRDHADLDLAGHGSQLRAIMELFVALGYAENPLARLGTEGRQLQFTRACEHVDPGLGVSLHTDDHVDVFLDTFVMDHKLDLRDRLGREDDYTLPVTDLLLTKLQIRKANDKDVRDILTLLKDRDLTGDGDDRYRGSSGAAIDARYIAAHCARDWGLYHDVVVNLERVAAAVETYELAAETKARLRAALDRLRRVIEEAPKSRAWRRRARIGTRKPWYNEVEDLDDEAA
jgi:hypothetical protein